MVEKFALRFKDAEMAQQPDAQSMDPRGWFTFGFPLNHLATEALRFKEAFDSAKAQNAKAVGRI